MDYVKCPRCGEEYSSSYHRCPFCEEEDSPRKVKNRTRSSHRVTEKKKTYSGRSALIIILLLVFALLTWVLFGEKLVERFAKPEEPVPPVEEVTPPVVNDDPFYDPSVGDGSGDVTDEVDPDAVEPPSADDPSADENTDVSNAKLSSEDFTMTVGESVQLKVTGTDATAVWSSKDPTVAVVGSSGLVTAINPGTTTITATVGGKTLEGIARVRSADPASGGANVDVSNAALSSEDFTAKVGERVTLRVTGTDAAAVWSIDDDSVASITAEGVVKGLKAGQTKVYAKVGGKTLTCIVRIK